MDPADAAMMVARPGCLMASPSITYKLPPLSAPMTVCVPAIKAGPADMSKSLSDIDFQLAGVNQSRGTDPLGGQLQKALAEVPDAVVVAIPRYGVDVTRLIRGRTAPRLPERTGVAIRRAHVD